jgi:hypothetical protein
MRIAGFSVPLGHERKCARIEGARDRRRRKIPRPAASGTILPVMSFKSRWVRIVLVVLAVLGFAGYFAFTTAFFNPMEGRLDADAAALVPRDVDFFFSKPRLSEAITKFPRLAVQDELEKKRAWQEWVSSPEYAKLKADLGIDKALESIQREMQNIPLGYEPQEVFGGEDIVVAGYFKGSKLEQADWAVYGRSNWMGKLGAAALLHPTWLGLEERGIKATIKGEVVSLVGNQLPRELFVTRVKDVVIVATKSELAQAAHDLGKKSYADSFFQSAIYADHIQNAPTRTDPDALELYVNSRKLLENLGVKTPIPDTKSQDFWPAFLGRMFQLPSVKTIVGVASADEGITLDLHGEFASETLTPEQQKLYRTRGFDQAELLEQAARMAPADTSVMVYLRGGIGDLLRTYLAAIEPAARSNIEDTFRNTGKYPNLEALVSELDGALKDRAVLIIRPNDYPPDPEGPPHNDVPVPAVALVLWPKNVETLTAFRETIGQNGSKFGLQGKTQGSPGFFKNQEAGFETREYWSLFVDGTGVIATTNAYEMTIITNSLGMLGHLFKTGSQGGDRKYPRLSDVAEFRGLVQSSLKQGTAFAWVNPRTLAPVLRKRSQRAAEDSVLGKIVWKDERRRLEDQALRESFPDAKRPLSAEQQQQVDAIVDPRIESMEQRLKNEQVPARLAEMERWIHWSEQCTAATLILSLNPKMFDLSVRAIIPLDADVAPPEQ